MSDLEWVATDACTLPTTEQPLRVREFDSLFAEALQGVERLGPTSLRLVLAGAAGLGDRVRDLADREGGCCSFFTFTVDEQPEPGGAAASRVQLDVGVPPERVEVLDALAGRARATRTDAGSTT